MTENKRVIHGSYGKQRYLHSDEIFCKERNRNIMLPSEREFKNGYCIITDKGNTAYSIDELVELLNEFQKENEQLKEENQELNHFLKNEIDLKIEYKKRVKEILQEYFDKYTEMAIELRNDKYGNGMCHDVTEVISEIADKLWIDLDLMGFKND